MFDSDLSDRVGSNFGSHNISFGTNLPYYRQFTQIDLHLSFGVLIIPLALTHTSKSCHVCHHFCMEKGRHKMWECTLIGLEMIALSLSSLRDDSKES